MKCVGQKNGSNNQITNTSVAGFGIIGNMSFTCVPSFSTPSNLGDPPDEMNCMSENNHAHEVRRPSVNSNDSISSISSLKSKISRSFSKSFEDNGPSHNRTSNSFDESTTRKSQKKGNRFTKFTKEISEKSRKSFKQMLSVIELPNQNRFSGSCHNASSPVENKSMHPAHGSSYINHVLTEIMNTEKSYVRDLKDIEQGYRVPMSQNIIFSDEDIHYVFCNIKHIYNFNRKLLKNLIRHRLDALRVCQVFLENKDGFHIYTNYCTNYQRSVETLEHYKEEPEQDAFIKNCQKLLKHPLPLHTYLFKPVQRILKYHLLLKSLSDHYDESSDDFGVVLAAYECMRSVAEDINEVQKAQDESSKVTRLLGNIQGLNGVSASNLGCLVIGGKLFSVGSREELKVFLMKKGILLTKKRKDLTLVFKMIIMCSDLVLVEVIPKEPLAFQIMDYVTPGNQCTLQASSEDEKRIWCREIKKVILDSIKANVPEKARLLLMKPGLRQDIEETEVMQKMSMKMSENLDYEGRTPGRSPKTSTPLNPFLRTKLRMTSFPKFTSEKKSRAKAKVNKRRSRSLETLNKLSRTFPSTTPVMEKVPFPEEGPVVQPSGGSCVEGSPVEVSGFRSNNSPTEQGFVSKRPPSFQMALTDDNNFIHFNVKPRISSTRSLSVTYSYSGDEEDDEEDEVEDAEITMESLSCCSSLVSQPLEDFCFEENNSCSPGDDDEDTAEELDRDHSTSLERQDSTITLSSDMSFNGNFSSESPGFMPSKPFDENFVFKTHFSPPKNHLMPELTSFNDSTSEVCSEERKDERSSSSDDLPEKSSPCETICDITGSVESSGDSSDFSCLLRNKRTSTGSGDKFRNSLLKRKTAFHKERNKFVPRRSKHYVQLEERQNSSLPSIVNIDIQSQEEEEPLMRVPADVKLALSEDSLPISSPIDDEEMICIILRAAREEESRAFQKEDGGGESRGGDGGAGDGEDASLRQSKEKKDSPEPPSNRNSGVTGLLELIASCQDLGEEVKDSFNGIKLSDESPPIEGVCRRFNGENIEPIDTILEEIDRKEEAPILKDEFKVDRFPRNKNYNYVFRLARAYSNRFRKMSGTNQNAVGSLTRSSKIQDGYESSMPEGYAIKSSSPSSSTFSVPRFADPAIQRAEQDCIVKQRIRQFQNKIS